MGVRSFTAFVDSRSKELLQSLKLHDRKVVIDGNNFYHFLYHYFHINQYHGGDYDVYYEKVNSVFEMFAKCNIDAYVVLDGGYEPDGRKLKTVLKNAYSRLSIIKEASKGGHGLVTPLLADEVFKNVLIDRHVPFVVCDFDADVQIAKLANDLECPVMSNDSDFCIFPMKAGLILLDYVNFVVGTDETDDGDVYNYISVELYHMDSFTKVFPHFKTQLFPMISILMGNDFIESSEFGKFFVNLTYASTKKLPKNQCKIIAIIRWLADIATCEQAINQILQLVNEDKEESVRRMIDISMSFYSMDLDTFDLQGCFNEGRDLCIVQQTDALYEGRKLPIWYYKAHRTGILQPSIINIPCLSMFLLQPQFENLHEQSAYTTSQDIRQTVYAIILNNSTQTVRREVKEYTRDNCGNLKKSLLKPITKLSPVPSLEDLTSYPRCKSLQVLLQIMSIQHSLVDSFAEELKLLSCAIIYWVRNSDPPVSKEHYLAMLVSLFRLQAKTAVSNFIPDAVEGEQYTGVKEHNCDTKNTSDVCEDVNESNESKNPERNSDSADAVQNSDAGNTEQSSEARDVQQNSDAGNTEQSSEARDVEQNSDAGDTKQNINARDTERNSGATDIEQNSYDRDTERNSDSLDAQQSLDSRNIDQNCHSRGMKLNCDITEDTNETKYDESAMVCIATTCLKSPKYELSKFLARCDKFTHDNDVSRKHPVDTSVTHGISQFLTCLLDCMNLNRIFQNPLTDPQIHTVFSGTFVYNFVHDLRKRSKPEMYIETLLGPKSLLWIVFQKINLILTQNLDDHPFQNSSLWKKFKKKTKKKDTKHVRSRSPIACNDEDNTVTSDVMSWSLCDIDNQFSSLTVL